MWAARNGQWLSAAIGEECALMSVDTGNYVTLSRVGTRIWEWLESPRAVTALQTLLTDEFDVPAEICRTELNAFLAELAKCHAITLSALP